MTEPFNPLAFPVGVYHAIKQNKANEAERAHKIKMDAERSKLLEDGELELEDPAKEFGPGNSYIRKPKANLKQKLTLEDLENLLFKGVRNE